MKKSTDGLKARFATNIKSKRLSLKLTQEQVAKRAKVSARYISQLESGEENVTLETVEAIATALKTAPAEILLEPKYLNANKQAALELAIELLASIKGNFE